MPGDISPQPRLLAKASSSDAAQAEVIGLDQEGRGVARVNGKVVFVDAALPGEHVELRPWRRKPRFDLANLTRILRASSLRVEPRCPHYERCGGCNLQHLDPRAQVAMKQRTLEENFQRIGKVQPDTLLAPIYGSDWGYRHRARLSIRMVPRKGGALVGFHERRTHLVVDMNSCDILASRVSALIGPLRSLISTLHLSTRIPQVEVAVGDESLALCLRVLDPLPERDRNLLQEFAEAQDIGIYVQPGGPASSYPVSETANRPLFYRLPEFDLRLEFRPRDFTQINHAINRVLVRRAVALLEPLGGQRVMDLFCGLGNFALALARRGADVFGVEGSMDLVKQAAGNAAANGLGEHASFICADLTRDPATLFKQLGAFDAV
ncbi:MAG: 23S rRNA (uracil(1939)-C(5))-methyltransferase RlmD, partial [Proteobacteria bacterium]